MEFLKALVPLLLVLSLVKSSTQAGVADSKKHERDFHREETPPDRVLQEQTPDRFHHEHDDYREDSNSYRHEDDDDFINEYDDDFNEDDDDFNEDDDDFQNEDDDDFQNEVRKANNLLRELISMQNEGHSKPPQLPQKATLEDYSTSQTETHTKPPKKVTFDEHTSTEAIVKRMMEDGDDYNESPGDDAAMNKLVMVTAEGYEYEQMPDELEDMFRESEGGPSLSSEYTESYFGANTENRMEASINATTQRVIGGDSRFRISNTNRYPWAAIGRIDTGCTGTFIGPRHILTAGHCVFNPYTRRWRRNLNFRRAKNCYPNRGKYYRWKNAVTVWGWIYGKREYDYAVIVVRKPSPVWISFGYQDPMPQFSVNIPGYPSDKSRQCMWHSHCKLIGRYKKMMSYNCDTYNGMSGSPVYAQFLWHHFHIRVIYGVHVGAGLDRNMAVRIDKRRYRTLRYIMKRFR